MAIVELPSVKVDTEIVCRMGGMWHGRGLAGPGQSSEALMLKYSRRIQSHAQAPPVFCAR